ncbi:unnamed protein product [Musa acuminata subsp. malaccensis]|uniref:(wild Malaysian banana) hypothetical protein n=1 Tax=Musa acuminata subsp. malaccensis TaxID=214687 RepID=A0A804L597_MUSAM|nr:unnamed protein product [Musa acuminata subsp. malaccensis]
MMVLILISYASVSFDSSTEKPMVPKEQKILQLNILFFHCYSIVLKGTYTERERERDERERERERETEMQMHLAGTQHHSEYITRGLVFVVLHPSLHMGNI